MTAESEQDVATAAKDASIVILAQRVVVGDAGIRALLRIQACIQLPGKRVQRFKLSARTGWRQLVDADESKPPKDASLCADPESRPPIHRRRQKAVHCA